MVRTQVDEDMGYTSLFLLAYNPTAIGVYRGSRYLPESLEESKRRRINPDHKYTMLAICEVHPQPFKTPISQLSLTYWPMSKHKELEPNLEKKMTELDKRMKPKELIYRSWTRREVRREAAGYSREGEYRGLALSWQRELTQKDTTIQPKTTGDSPDDDQNIQMRPYVLSPTHDSFSQWRWRW